MVAVVEHGLRILGWQENLISDEMPPEWMWHLDHELVDWFEEVAAIRREKYGIQPDDEVVPMTDNELVAGRRNGR